METEAMIDVFRVSRFRLVMSGSQTCRSRHVYWMRRYALCDISDTLREKNERHLGLCEVAQDGEDESVSGRISPRQAASRHLHTTDKVGVADMPCLWIARSGSNLMRPMSIYHWKWAYLDLYALQCGIKAHSFWQYPESPSLVTNLSHALTTPKLSLMHHFVRSFIIVGSSLRTSTTTVQHSTSRLLLILQPLPLLQTLHN